jgi:hypothetical protein
LDGILKSRFVRSGFFVDEERGGAEKIAPVVVESPRRQRGCGSGSEGTRDSLRGLERKTGRVMSKENGLGFETLKFKKMLFSGWLFLIFVS